MTIEDFIVEVKKGKKGLYKYMNYTAEYVYNFNIPSPKIVFRPLYELLIIFRYIYPFVIEKLIYAPIFKSRCDRCGKALSIRNKIPWVEGNLIIRIGDNVTLDDVAFVSGKSNVKPVLTIGDGTFISHNVEISVLKNVTIGKNCLIGATFISDNNGHWTNPEKRKSKEPLSNSEARPVTIGDNVWIGKGAVILPGVTIGRGSIVSANSLVNSSVPPNSIVMGVPAQKIKGDIDKLNR